MAIFFNVYHQITNNIGPWLEPHDTFGIYFSAIQNKNAAHWFSSSNLEPKHSKMAIIVR